MFIFIFESKVSTNALLEYLVNDMYNVYYYNRLRVVPTWLPTIQPTNPAKSVQINDNYTYLPVLFKNRNEFLLKNKNSLQDLQSH